MKTPEEALRLVRDAEPCAFVRLQTRQELVQIRYEGLEDSAHGVRATYAVYMRVLRGWHQVDERFALEWLRDKGPFVAEVVPEGEGRTDVALESSHHQ